MTLISNRTPYVKCQHVLICGDGLGTQLLNPLRHNCWFCTNFTPQSADTTEKKEEKWLPGIPNFSIYN